MKPWSRLEWLYLVNAALLFTHEIDSAYWHEWRLFRLPGGIQLFLVLNLASVGLFLYGFRLLVQGGRAGLVYSLLLAAAGVSAFVLHGAFLLAGDAAFRLPVSLLLLAASLGVSLVQGAMAFRALRS